MSLKLIYFKMRALAEAPQMLMNYAGIKYEYIMSWDYFEDEWKNVKPKIAFKQLPLLIIDGGYEIPQSLAILTYIEKLAGLYIEDPIIAAKADAILNGAQELFLPLNPIVNFAVGEDFKNKRDDLMPSLLSKFDDLNRLLELSNTNYFIDDRPHACDFLAFHHLDLSRFLDGSLVKKFPRIEKFLNAIEEIDTINNYLINRPKLIDVSIDPKLVIEGVPEPTGINKG
ncbi:MAG: hypothetical protein CFH01_01010 [Alphaproteobacteria bacterium MarineAlpha2_Bin1]|nr:MAG: hypothetical protein CFH01_01010 [Alphaproteobacteria bacterium MarineAlpha2_Bin1]|tara:strand:+ start:922 stop:1602 length:681 start_codon:yes stop_codon:yes gene_type:complete